MSGARPPRAALAVASAPSLGPPGLDGLLRRLRDSETKRLELERELIDYRKSDAYAVKLKYTKLKKYLKEIDERQKKALLRNQTFLREFNQFEAHMKTSSSEIIQKMEVQYGREIKSVLSLQGSSLPARGDEDDCSKQVPLVARQAGINTGTAMSRGLYHPATIFMGRQMSAISSTEDFSTQQKSFQPIKSFSISDPHSCRQAAQSSNMTDSYVVQTNSDMQCLNKPDKIDVETDLQMGEKMPLTSSMSSENGRTHCLAIESNANNGRINLAESKKSAKLSSPLHERLNPENRTTDFKSTSSSRPVKEVVTSEHFVANEERSEQPVSLVSTSELIISEKEHLQESLPEPEHHVNNCTSKQTSSDSSSDLTVSVTEEDDVINATEPQQSLEDIYSKMALKAVSSEQERDTRSVERFSLQSSNLCTAEEEPSVSSAPEGDCLTFEGFSHLLQFVEDLIEIASPKGMALYQSGSTSAAKMKQLISFCNRAGNLKEDDLETCEAVVLHQLQSLLQSILNGCLLPEKTLNVEGRAMGEKQIRSDQQLDLAKLWACLSKHALFLKKHHVLLTEEVAKMFDTLLISEKNVQDAQALPLLREVLPEECEDRSSIQSNESSYSLPSILNDRGEIKQSKHAHWLDSVGTREQERNIGDNSSKPKKRQEMSSEASTSSNEGSRPSSRTESRRGTVAAIQSKAFWGESDDSNSEIEAALRPQTHNTEADEFDDFYD
ncbi:centrosomal protein kizuna isoform X3 [Struthio camelus]|uniref:centrosomal protein kizuna isoform X3 n=2 Tax=Struthio camelus TaxID=8801 RepID=UPI003603E45B